MVRREHNCCLDYVHGEWFLLFWREVMGSWVGFKADFDARARGSRATSHMWLGLWNKHTLKHNFS